MNAWRQRFIDAGILRPADAPPRDVAIPEGVRVLALDDAGRASAARSIAKRSGDASAILEQADINQRRRRSS